MLVEINGVDITPHIDKKSYKMNAESKYQSWEDGNFVEHRIYSRAKVKGSFDVCLYGKNNIDTNAFLETWYGGVTNNIATMLVYVQNTNQNEAIEAYFEFEGKFHRELLNGDYCDKITIKISER